MRRTRMDDIARAPTGRGDAGPVLVVAVLLAGAVGYAPGSAGAAAPNAAAAGPLTQFVRHICPKVADKPQKTGSEAQLSSNVREYDAPRVAAPPAIDGALGDAAWLTAPWTEPFVDIRGEDWPDPSLATRVRIVWDEDHLYIGAELREPHMWATLGERDAILYREHDFEVFLDPDGDALDYYELEINAMGTEFDLFLDRPYRRKGKANVAWDMVGLRTAVGLDGTLNDPADEDRGWTVEIAIPWAALRPPESAAAPGVLESPERPASGARNMATAGAAGRSSPQLPGAPPSPGDSWRVNFSRVQWPVEVVGGQYRRAQVPNRENRHPEHNWVWSPQGEIDMHIPEMWGIVRFTEEAKR